MSPVSFPLSRRAESPLLLPVLLAAAFFGSVGCEHVYLPLQPGYYEKRGVKIDDGPFVLEVIALRPSATVTVSPGQAVALGFTIECKSDKTIGWGLYFVRDDGELLNITALSCPPENHPRPFAINWAIEKGVNEYMFGHGHTLSIRAAAGATPQDVVNDGPFTYFGTRDLMTWKMLD